MSCARFVQALVLHWIAMIILEAAELKPKILTVIFQKLCSKFETIQGIDQTLLYVLRSSLIGL